MLLLMSYEVINSPTEVIYSVVVDTLLDSSSCLVQETDNRLAGRTTAADGN
ncbi:hypothetical protein J6590_004488 [Homalodisca vitripennis]|nr:hypothetical protein J6590_004488 [Homalodisca vitripennis]